MPTMLELIKSSAVPSNLVQAAARGALSVPPAEMIEILVHLTSNPVFTDQARLTLAGWGETETRAVATDSKSSQEVLDYLIAPENLRPKLLPALLENPSVDESKLVELAATGSREAVAAILASQRAGSSVEILHALSSSPHLTEQEAEKLRVQIQALEATAPTATEPTPAPSESVAAANPDAEIAEENPELENQIMEVLTAFEREHAAELAADPGKPFQPLGGFAGELQLETLATPESGQSATGHVAQQKSAHPAAAAAAKAQTKSLSDTHDRVSTLQKIANLDVKGRIHLAVRGNKEERAILVRDGTKLVALSVLESPKISDGEVEKFAGQRNVLEALLRGIPMKRRFAKNYVVVRNLVANPRTPIDVSLPLMKNLLVNDLRAISGNKDVSDTIRKVAMKMFKMKSGAKKGE